jgi:uncharacterized protein (DUF849 family)
MSVQACLNGNRRREEHDALPLTPEELARDAAAVVEAGAIDGGLERAGIGLPQLHHGIDTATWVVMDAAVRRGRTVRVGLEDTLALPDARRARDNAELVAATVERYRGS